MKALLVFILACIPVTANAQLKSPLGIIPKDEWNQLNPEEQLDFLGALNGCDNILDSLAGGEGAGNGDIEHAVDIRPLGKFVRNADGSKTLIGLTPTADEKGAPGGKGATTECDEDSICQTFLRGDGNGSGGYDTDDDDATLDFLYSSIQDNPADDAYDVDDDGNFDYADFTAIHNYVHHSTGTIAEPNSTTGIGLDPTDDSIDAYCTAPYQASSWYESCTSAAIAITDNGVGSQCEFTYTGPGTETGSHASGYWAGLKDMSSACTCDHEFSWGEGYLLAAEHAFYFEAEDSPMSIGLLGSKVGSNAAIELQLGHKCELAESFSSCSCTYSTDSSCASYSTNTVWELYLMDEWGYLYGYEVYNWGTHHTWDQVCGSTRVNSGNTWKELHIDGTAFTEQLCEWGLGSEDIVCLNELSGNEVDLLEMFYEGSDQKAFRCYNVDPKTYMRNGWWKQK